MAQQRFPIRFTGANEAMTVLGPRTSSAHPAALCEELATPAPA
jgi:hypothetical protein